MGGKPWTDKEIGKLKELWDSSRTKEEVAEELPGRTPTAVKVKAKRLGLRHTEEQTSEILSKKTSGKKNGMYGKVGPRRGVDVSEETRRKISEKAKKEFESGKRKKLYGKNNPMYEMTGEKNPRWNTPLPESAKKSLSRQAKQRWESLSEEQQQEKLRQLRTGLAKLKKGESSSIEDTVEEWLNQLGYCFESQELVELYVVDFLVDGDKVVEVFGDYWHAHPEFKPDDPLTAAQEKNVKKDQEKREIFSEKDIPLLELWECEIQDEPEKTKQRLKGFLDE